LVFPRTYFATLQADGKVAQATGKLQAKFGDAVDQISDTASATADQASDFAGRAGARLRDAAGAARRGAEHASETVYDAGAQASQYVGRSVQQQPLLSLIGAAAIGYVLGLLIHSGASPLLSAPKPRRHFR
jgi:ElaB/YqjD/DUF883 family membrane-anchored ribosome-binding protein